MLVLASMLLPEPVPHPLKIIIFLNELILRSTEICSPVSRGKIRRFGEQQLITGRGLGWVGE